MSRDIHDSDTPLNTARRVDPSTPAGALVHARDLDKFRLPDGRPDPRGWDVRSADGKRLGTVEDLLVDTASNQVRYLEINVDDDVVKAGGRDFALVPIGAARLDDERDDVQVQLTAQDLCEVPLYDRKRLSRDYERSLHGFVSDRSRTTSRAGALGASAATAAATARTDTHLPADVADDLYSSSYYDDRSFFGSRDARTSGARTSGARTSGAADRATTTGVGDRLADAADNLKDRIDANPASRPGPDATDRPISAPGTASRVGNAGERLADRADGAWERTKDAASNLGQRATNAVDNVKDRIDGNPASRPGPDPTDRRF